MFFTFGVWVFQIPALHDLAHERYTLLAACRPNHRKCPYTRCPLGYSLITSVVSSKKVTVKEIGVISQVASANVTARYPNQHPILKGAQNARFLGTDHLAIPRYLGTQKLHEAGGTKVVKMDGGLVTDLQATIVEPIPCPSSRRVGAEN